MSAIKTKLIAYVNAIGSPKSGITNPDKKSNTGSALFEAYVWQEIAAYAEEQEKKAWEAVLESSGYADDEALRSEGQGEHIVAESAVLTAIAKITAPRKTFSRETFIENVHKKHKVPKAKLEALVKESMVEGKAPLSKRILEAPT